MDALRKAEALIEALNYIRTFRDRLTVIKVLRANLGADGKATPATVASVAGLVRALAEGVRGVRRRVLATN